MDVRILLENDQLRPRFKKAILQETTRLKSGDSGWGKGQNVLGNRRGGHRKRGGGHRHVRAPLHYSRRVIVRNRIVRMNEYGKKAAKLHLKYVEREGVEQDGSKGILYGSRDGFDRDSMSKELPGEQNQFRFIISPEDGAEVDLTALTRRLVRRMEMDTGRKFIWGAVNHYNTDNPHTHLIIRGVDADGDEVRLERDYITSGIRHQAADLLTKELGSRARLDVVRQFVREVEQDRYTSLDAAINKQAEGLRLNECDIESTFVPTKAIQARLRYLQRVQLASRNKQGQWRLDEGWESKLRDLGKHAEIINSMQQRHKSHNNNSLVILQPNHEITGRIVSKGLSDEMYDRVYIDVEATDGRIYHIETSKTADKVTPNKGDLITVKRQDISHSNKINSITKISLKREPSSNLSLNEQTRHPGRVWLDHFVDAQDALSSEGFAGAVRDAAVKRAAWLKAMNVTGSTDERNQMLDQLERDKLVERFSARHNLKYVALKGKTSIAGKLEVSQELASGRRYGLVVDERRGSFSLVPWRKDYEAGLSVRAQWREGRLSVTTMRNKELDRG